jgi:hypothetical protein
MKLRNSITMLLITTAILLLTACSGGDSAVDGGGSASNTVTAVDGYIKDANMTDNAGQVGVYSSNGKYTFANSIAYPLHLTGGRLEDTNTSFDINMTCQSGRIVSPITTFLENNSTLLGKLANLGLGFSTLGEFQADYVNTNNSNLAKLSQLLYVIQKDAHLTAAFKTALEGANPADLSELFTLAEAEVNATIGGGHVVQYRALLTTVNNLTGNVADYETTIKIAKESLNEDLSPRDNFLGLTYGKVISPYTGKVWLDRNLGATQACTAFDDTACYGDYYQWGRLKSYVNGGHQKSNSTTDTTLQTSVFASGANFITGSDDWTDADTNGSERSQNWSKTDGLLSIGNRYMCPVGFRVPTIKELADETVDARASDHPNIAGFNSFLKLPSAGLRERSSGSLSQGGYGVVWASDANNMHKSSALFLRGYNNSVGMGGTIDSYTGLENYERSYGASVRCIKESLPVANTAGIPTSRGIKDPITPRIFKILTQNSLNFSTYAWSIEVKPDGSNLVLTNNIGEIGFTADVLGNYTFKLVVYDRNGNSSEDLLIITITEFTPPPPE